MTARRLARPDWVDVPDRPDLRGRGPWPDVVWLRLDTLELPDWQRSVSRAGRKLVERMAAAFDPAAFGVLLVAVEGDRRLLIDGQHRALAAMAAGAVSAPCLAVDGRAAARFVAVNRARLGLSPLQVWRAEVAAGDAEAVRLAEIVADAGLTLGRREPHGLKPRVIDCVGLMRRAMRRELGPEILEAALIALAEAGQADGGYLAARVVRPAIELTARLYSESGEALPDDLGLLPATFADAPDIAEQAAARAARMGGRPADHAAQMMAAEHARLGGTEIVVGW